MKPVHNRMTQIVEESERSEDEEEDDFEAITNQNLTINLPKHIRESLRRRQTELEMLTGNSNNSPLNI